MFAYTVQATDVDADGIWAGDQTRTIKLDGDDSIRTSAGGAAANLAHRSLGTQAAHKVDGTRSPPAGVELDPPLTASLSGGPPEHDGRTPFKVTLTFSEEVSMGYRTVREKLFTVSGAAITDVRRLTRRSNLRYELTVRPSGNGAVRLARASLPRCGESDTICTADNRALQGPAAFTVPGPAVLSVADATVEEGPDAALAFAVTLDRERHAAVTVDYATSDGSATAGQDYTAASGTLTFAAGETAKTVSVAVLDDTEVEGRLETFTLSLSNAAGARIADGRAVGTIENPQSETAARFIASLSGVPAGHDGRTPFNLTLTFSEEVSMSYKAVRDNLFTVSGGTIPKVRRLNPPSNLRYEVTVQPGGNDPVRLARAALPACGQSGSICTSDGRALEGVLSATVPGPPVTVEPVELTASLSGVPAEHDGKTPFKLTLTFSKRAYMRYTEVRDYLFTVTGGMITNARRLNPPSNRRYELTVRPTGNAPVMLAQAALPACGQVGSICTPDRRPLEGAISVTVPGPPGLSVADARVDEAENATADFAVTLSRASTATVTVDYETSDGTATQGNDYEAASGTLTFAPGETKKTVSVTVLDDSHNEGEETFTLTLSNLSGGNVFLADATATGTIVNADPLPRALMARFGRTVGSQVVDAVSERVDGGPSASYFNVGGVSLGDGVTPLDDTARLTPRDWLARQMTQGPEERTLTERDLLLGSSFHLVSQAGEDGGAVWSAWGRVSTGGFSAEVDGMTMDGDVVTGLLGFDAEWDRLLAGVLVLRSEGEGGYNQLDGDSSGTLESTLTGVYPYARLLLGGRLSVWAVAGVGTGDLHLTHGAEVYDTGLDVRMGALGARGGLPAVAGLDMAVKSDVLWVRTASDAVSGKLAAASAQVNRLRLILEGSRPWALASGAVLAPTLQIGLRHDGGDAETGTGVEVGAGFRYGAGILSVEGQVRTLLAHEAGGYEEWGAGGSIRLSPNASGLGPSLAVLPAWGATGSGVEQLWSYSDASALVQGGPASAAVARLGAELGYGLPALRGRGVLTPYARSAWAEDGNQSWHLGTQLALAESLDVSVEGGHRRWAGGSTAYDLTLRATLPW